MYKWREGRAVKLLGFLIIPYVFFIEVYLIYSVSYIDLQQEIQLYMRI